ncbi:MAG: phosphate/phosphite/phosphonate ABC transporter substrate-binding protein, partial [Bdellovibrionota bacterium]
MATISSTGYKRAQGIMAQRLLKIIFLSAFLLLSGSAMSSAATFWVGVTPWQKGQTGDDINRLYIPLLKWLSENTGEEFKIKIMNSYEGTIDQIAEGHIQVAMLSPEPYIKAKKANPEIELLVTELSWNHDKTKKLDSYRAHILARKDRTDLVDFRSLKGKKIAFVSEESTSGYRVPHAYLRQQHIEANHYFSQAQFLGSHPSVTDAIAAGSVDAGATWDFNWKQAVEKNGDI